MIMLYLLLIHALFWLLMIWSPQVDGHLRVSAFETPPTGPCDFAPSSRQVSLQTLDDNSGGGINYNSDHFNNADHPSDSNYLANLEALGLKTSEKTSESFPNNIDAADSRAYLGNLDASSYSKYCRPVKKYSCSVCPYAGYTPSNLKAHEMKHTGQRPYGCPFCAYRSSWKHAVIRHMLGKHPGNMEAVPLEYNWI